jgi:hypothetical protein
VSGGRDRRPNYGNACTKSIGRWLYQQKKWRRTFLSPGGTSPSPSESHETVEEKPSEGAEPRSDAPGPQEGARRRSLWRRVFGR